MEAEIKPVNGNGGAQPDCDSNGDHESVAQRRIVIVGEMTELLEFLGHALVQEGYRVRYVHDARPSVADIGRKRPDVAIVDGSESFAMAEEFCAQLRGRPALDGCRVLLFGEAGQNGSAIGPSVLGADVYLGRPLHPRTVIDTVHQLLQNKNWNPGAEKIVSGNLSIDPCSFRVTRPGKMVSLPATEFRLLYHLASRPNMLCPRAELLHLITGRAVSPIRTVDVYMRSLRKKIEDNPRKPDLICTVQGHGYMLRAPEPPVPEKMAANSANGGSHEVADHRG